MKPESLNAIISSDLKTKEILYANKNTYNSYTSKVTCYQINSTFRSSKLQNL